MQISKADAIIGNPPFLGGKHMRTTLGDEYSKQVFDRFPTIKDSVDFCAYWFRLAHDHIDENGRVGLVATNSISQGKSRVATLDYIAQNNGHIYDAISTQPWSGEAKVHVSLVNWSKQKPKILRLDNQIVSSINSALKSTVDVSGAVRLKANLNCCFQGVIPLGQGFIVTEREIKEWLDYDYRNVDVLKNFSMGANLAKNPHGNPGRFIIDFNNMSLEEASEYWLPFQHVKTYVKPERENNRDSKARENWWKFLRSRPDMREAIAPLSKYFTVPRVSKWAVFIPADPRWLPGDKSVVVASDDFYILGVLTSTVHRTWMDAQKSTLKADIAYTHNTCFETFPFPQSNSAFLVAQIRSATQALHDYRTKWMDKKQWGITHLYNEWFYESSSQLAKLHAELDELVMKAYGFKKGDDILKELLSLNLQLAEREKFGETVIGAIAPEQWNDLAEAEHYNLNAISC